MSNTEKIEKILDLWEEANSPSDISSFLAALDVVLSAQEKFEVQNRIRKLIQVNHRLNNLNINNDIISDTDKNTESLSRTRFRKNEEPIPGYRLVDFIGEGGYGEVWKAIAPGGFEVALKILKNSSQYNIERKALPLLRAIHHPNLIPIFGAWETDQGIVIAMQLAEQSLEDKFSERNSTPFSKQELLNYFTDIARAVDYLNFPQSSEREKIQHGDIKPDNIFLAGGAVQLGDFSLVKSFQNTSTVHPGSLSLSFAAPECLQGRISDYSDQYSLAVTWYYLRSGHLPFEGSPGEVVQAHLFTPPDLSCFVGNERVALAHALAKKPSERWKNCTEFVRILNTPDSSPITKHSSKNGLFICTLLGIALLFLGGSMFFWNFFDHNKEKQKTDSTQNREQLPLQKPVLQSKPSEPDPSVNKPKTTSRETSQTPVPKQPQSDTEAVDEMKTQIRKKLHDEYQSVLDACIQFESDLFDIKEKYPLNSEIYMPLYQKDPLLALNYYLAHQSVMIDPLMETLPVYNARQNPNCKIYLDLNVYDEVLFWCRVFKADPELCTQTDISSEGLGLYDHRAGIVYSLQNSVYDLQAYALNCLGKIEELQQLNEKAKSFYPDNDKVQRRILKIISGELNICKNQTSEQLNQKKRSCDIWKNEVNQELVRRCVKRQQDFYNSLKRWEDPHKYLDNLYDILLSSDDKKDGSGYQSEMNSFMRSELEKQYRSVYLASRKYSHEKKWFLFEDTLHLGGCPEVIKSLAKRPENRQARTFTSDELAAYYESLQPEYRLKNNSQSSDDVDSLFKESVILCNVCRPQFAFPPNSRFAKWNHEQSKKQIVQLLADEPKEKPFSKDPDLLQMLCTHFYIEPEPELHDLFRSLAERTCANPPACRFYIKSSLMTLIPILTDDDLKWLGYLACNSIWWDVRNSSAWTLGQIERPECKTYLQNAIEREPFYFVRRQMEAALNRHLQSEKK